MPSSNRVEPDHHALVERAVLDERRFVRALFTGRLPGHPLEWKRVLIRPVSVKGRPHVQFTYYDPAKSVDRNLRGAAARDELRSLLRMPFRNVHVETTERTIQINLSRKGRPVVKTTHRPAPAARSLTHDRQKRLPLPPGTPDAYLVAVGIMTEDGRVRAERHDKFRQINEFVRLLGQTVSSGEERFRPTCVVDFGCGNAYLTFATYHYLRNVLGLSIRMYGVDAREAPLITHREKAAQLGWDGLRFVASTIEDFDPPEAPDLVVSLHACDTATDDALARAIGWQSRYVLSVPCCHHDLQVQLRERRDATPLRPVYRYGVLAERLGDVLTDTLRALLLRLYGYRCDVVQFVSSEHTAKNLMLRAARSGAVGDPAIADEYRRLRDFLQVTPALERLLRRDSGAPVRSPTRAVQPPWWEYPA
jgi:SAM-dependent methyltransferase